MEKRTSGLTIVELLIVIVVIAILVAIALVSYQGLRERAQVASIVDGLGKVEKAFRLWTIDDGLHSWPIDPVLGGGTRFIDMYSIYPTLNKYLQQPPDVMGVHSEDWFYDNDGDIKSECSGTYNGVNIVIRYVDSEQIAQTVDEALDDGNLECGKVRYADERIFYSLSYDQSVN